jgi:hypothetical protein
MDRSIKDIYWLAGLLEGEGSFNTPCNYYAQGRILKLTISLGMTDKDIVQKAKDIIYGNNTFECATNPGDYNEKDEHCFVISGRLCIEWCLTLYSLMGDRRKQQIKNILNAWEKNQFCKRNHRYPPGTRKCYLCESLMNTLSGRHSRRSELKDILIDSGITNV